MPTRYSILLLGSAILAVWTFHVNIATASPPTLSIQQITTGPKHHFFGYIGHVKTIPWNASGRYIVSLRTDFQDRMPGPSDAAEIVLLDTQDEYRIHSITKTHAWNFQQGTMMYWNPEQAETQFFFNDRDPRTNQVFCVLYDISAGLPGRRVREYRFEDTPFGSSGVAQSGGFFLGINYGRLARLRPVTGYGGAYDWTKDDKHPRDDGVFRVNIETGKKELIVSYWQLAEALRPLRPDIDEIPLFINHTLCNRDDDRIYFYARGHFGRRPTRVDVPFTVNPDGTGLTPHALHVGGHPEWDRGHRIIGSHDGKQVIYDTNSQEIVQQLGTREIFPGPGGDIALSPDAEWFVNGYAQGNHNYYVFFCRADRRFVRSRAFSRAGWTNGDLRIDPAPCWNRTGNQVLFMAAAEDEEKNVPTRQLFIATLKAD